MYEQKIYENNNRKNIKKPWHDKILDFIKINKQSVMNWKELSKTKNVTKVFSTKKKKRIKKLSFLLYKANKNK